MTDKEFITQLLELMMNRLDFYERKILNIRDSRFYRGFDEKDYFDLLVTNAELHAVREEFVKIRQLIHVYTFSNVNNNK